MYAYEKLTPYLFYFVLSDHITYNGSFENKLWIYFQRKYVLAVKPLVMLSEMID